MAASRSASSVCVAGGVRHFPLLGDMAIVERLLGLVLMFVLVVMLVVLVVLCLGCEERLWV